MLNGSYIERYVQCLRISLIIIISSVCLSVSESKSNPIPYHYVFVCSSAMNTQKTSGFPTGLWDSPTNFLTIKPIHFFIYEVHSCIWHIQKKKKTIFQGFLHLKKLKNPTFVPFFPWTGPRILGLVGTLGCRFAPLGGFLLGLLSLWKGVNKQGESGSKKQICRFFLIQICRKTVEHVPVLLLYSIYTDFCLIYAWCNTM